MMVNANKSKQVSESQQQSTANSTGWNYGQNQSFNLGQQGASNFGQTSQDVWGAQSPALQSLYGAAQSMLGSGAGQGVTDQAQAAWAQQLTPGGNPYFSQSLQGAIDAATRGFNQNVLPGLADQGVRADAMGTPRHQLAVGQAAGQFGQDLTNMVGQMSSQQYTADQNRALGALGMSGQMQGMQFAPLLAAAQAIGGPTVLGQSQTGGQSFGTSVGGSSGFTAGGNQSNAQSSGFGGSTGRSAGFGIASK
jgi:hypothetical protein